MKVYGVEIWKLDAPWSGSRDTRLRVLVGPTAGERMKFVFRLKDGTEILIAVDGNVSTFLNLLERYSEDSTDSFFELGESMNGNIVVGPGNEVLIRFGIGDFNRQIAVRMMIWELSNLIERVKNFWEVASGEYGE